MVEILHDGGLSVYRGQQIGTEKFLSITVQAKNNVKTDLMLPLGGGANFSKDRFTSDCDNLRLCLMALDCYNMYIKYIL